MKNNGSLTREVSQWVLAAALVIAAVLILRFGQNQAHAQEMQRDGAQETECG